MNAFFRQTTVFCALVSILLCALPAFSQQFDNAISPLVKWNINYANSECRLVRSFGAKDRVTTVQFTQRNTGDDVELSVASPDIPNDNKMMKGQLATKSHPSSIEVIGNVRVREGAIPPIVHIASTAGLLASLRQDAATAIPSILQVSIGRNHSVTINLGSMAKPLRALDTCVDDLLKSYGFDPAEQRALIQRPQPKNDPAKWFSSDDFPANFGVAGAVVIFRVTVAADGHIEDCSIAKAAGEKIFEQLTCNAVRKRARFQPAIGADQRPTRSMFFQTVTWHY